MGEPRKPRPSFCGDCKHCTCNVHMKNTFFTEYKRFGINVYIEGGYVKLESTRVASKGKKISR